jgi:hypothetical protein
MRRNPSVKQVAVKTYKDTLVASKLLYRPKRLYRALLQLDLVQSLYKHPLLILLNW